MAQTAGHAVPVTVTDKGDKNAAAMPSDTTKTDSIDRDMTLGELVVKADHVRRRPGGYTVNLTGSGLAKGVDAAASRGASPPKGATCTMACPS